MDPAHPWAFEGRVALIENQEVFLRAERLLQGIDLALWTSGKVAQRVLDWLALQDGVTALHVGDYDPVGLAEYHRLKKALGRRADLYIPQDLEVLVARYGQTKLLTDSVAALERVRREADDRTLIVLDILDRQNKGLEHEALAIRSPSDE